MKSLSRKKYLLLRFDIGIFCVIWLAQTRQLIAFLDENIVVGRLLDSNTGFGHGKAGGGGSEGKMVGQGVNEDGMAGGFKKGGWECRNLAASTSPSQILQLTFGNLTHCMPYSKKLWWFISTVGAL